MRKIISIHQVTLDGVIQGPGGPEEDLSGGFKYGGWVAPFQEPALGEEINKLMATDFDLLLGRRTFEIWQAYWPYQDGSIAGPFNKARKYVATTTLDTFEWDKTQLLKGDVAGEIRKLKESTGPDLHIWGSGKLMQTLLKNDLIDEMRLWIFPIIIGEGKKMFEDGLPARTMRVVEARSTPSGIQMCTYHPAGQLKSGSMNDEAPTAKELARQRKHAEEDSNS
jgi:dihydrofolate reductase